MRLNVSNKKANRSVALKNVEPDSRPTWLAASSIVSEDVKNRKGQQIGKLKDLMINVHTGKIEYLVLEVPTFLGLSNKLFAIPFSELCKDELTKRLIADRSKYYLKDLPGFDKSHWPATNLHEYKSEAGSPLGTPALSVGYQ